MIEGLEKVHVLEELNLEENRIVRMEALSSLRFLKKLDLGKNRISKVEGISSLSQLSQLSLEDNELVSLEGLGRLPALMELYIGNNRIDNIKEVLSLKDLPKLIILDLSGNPLCRHEKYRLYTVYHLRRLKVLDGVGVDNTEQAAARDRFSGRLTAEFLEEKIGHTYFEAIRELDLAQCRIREIEGLRYASAPACLRVCVFELSIFGVAQLCTAFVLPSLAQQRRHVPVLVLSKLGPQPADGLGAGWPDTAAPPVGAAVEPQPHLLAAARVHRRGAHCARLGSGQAQHRSGPWPARRLRRLVCAPRGAATGLQPNL